MCVNHVVDIPHLVPNIINQKDNLVYLCKASAIPVSSAFHYPLHVFESAISMVVRELASDMTIKKLTQLKQEHSWINDESRVYFELVGNASHLFEDIWVICSKSYSSDGIIFTSIYYEGTVYLTIQEACGEQPLVGVEFPEVSSAPSLHSRTLSLYDSQESPWMKLSIWQAKPKNACVDSKDFTKPSAKERDMDTSCSIGNFSICSSASSTSENEGLTTAVTSSIIGILDDAMIEICDEFDGVMVDCGFGENINTTEQTRAAKLNMLEKRLLEIRDEGNVN